MEKQEGIELELKFLKKKFEYIVWSLMTEWYGCIKLIDKTKIMRSVF